MIAFLSEYQIPIAALAAYIILLAVSWKKCDKQDCKHCECDIGFFVLVLFAGMAIFVTWGFLMYIRAVAGTAIFIHIN